MSEIITERMNIKIWGEGHPILCSSCGNNVFVCVDDTGGLRNICNKCGAPMSQSFILTPAEPIA